MKLGNSFYGTAAGMVNHLQLPPFAVPTGWGANSVLGKSLAFLQLSVPHYHPSPPRTVATGSSHFRPSDRGGGGGEGGIKVLDEGLE